MISWRRPSNRSRRLAGPSGPSKRYSFSTAIHGIRRRLAASASRARVSFFSSTSSSARAAFHSCGDTIGGVFIVAVLPQILVDDVEQAPPQARLRSIQAVASLSTAGPSEGQWVRLRSYAAACRSPRAGRQRRTCAARVPAVSTNGSGPPTWPTIRAAVIAALEEAGYLQIPKAGAAIQTLT